jgi:hypothetical protein
LLAVVAVVDTQLAVTALVAVVQADLCTLMIFLLLLGLIQ